MEIRGMRGIVGEVGIYGRTELGWPELFGFTFTGRRSPGVSLGLHMHPWLSLALALALALGVMWVVGGEWCDSVAGAEW